VGTFLPTLTPPKIPSDSDSTAPASWHNHCENLKSKSNLLDGQFLVSHNGEYRFGDQHITWTQQNTSDYEPDNTLKCHIKCCNCRS
jgi:hypothetical protein